jgi:hypothetical protein
MFNDMRISVERSRTNQVSGQDNGSRHDHEQTDSQRRGWAGHDSGFGAGSGGDSVRYRCLQDKSGNRSSDKRALGFQESSAGHSPRGRFLTRERCLQSPGDIGSSDLVGGTLRRLANVFETRRTEPHAMGFSAWIKSGRSSFWLLHIFV